MLTKNAAVAYRTSMQHRNEEITVNVGTGAFSRGHRIQKMYYHGDTHQTNFIQVRDKIREIIPAMFDGLAANLFKENKVADAGVVVRPKDTMEKRDSDGEIIVTKGTNDPVLIPNPTFRAELEDYKRESTRIESEKQKLKGQLAGIWLFLIEILSPSSIDRLSAQETYMEIQKDKDPEKLWNLIVLTHLDKADVDTIARLITAILNFFTLTQAPGEDLLEYLRRFKESYERLVAAEPEKFFENLPQMHVRLFLGNLEPRFAEYKLDVLNGIQLRGESWPTTVTQIATDARQFLVRRAKVGGKPTGLSQTGSLLTTVDNNPRTPTARTAPRSGGCHHCGGAHYLQTCPTHDPSTHSHYGVTLRPRTATSEDAGRGGGDAGGSRGGRGGRRGRGRGGRTAGAGRTHEAAHIASDDHEEHVFSYTPRFTDLDEEDTLGHEDSLFMMYDAHMPKSAAPATQPGEEVVRVASKKKFPIDKKMRAAASQSKKKRPIVKKQTPIDREENEKEREEERSAPMEEESSRDEDPRDHVCHIVVDGIRFTASQLVGHTPESVRQAIRERGGTDMLEHGHTVSELREMARSRPLSQDARALMARGLAEQARARQLEDEWQAEHSGLPQANDEYQPRFGPPIGEHWVHVTHAENRNNLEHRYPERMVPPEIRPLVDARMGRAWPDATRVMPHYGRTRYPREMHDMSRSIRGEFVGERRRTQPADTRERARQATQEHLLDMVRRPVSPDSTEPNRRVSDAEDAAIRNHLEGLRLEPRETCDLDCRGTLNLEERLGDDPVLLLAVTKFLVRYDNEVVTQRASGVHNPSWRACIHGHLDGNRRIPRTMEEFWDMISAESNANNAPAPEYLPEVIPIVWRGPRICREFRVTALDEEEHQAEGPEGPLPEHPGDSTDHTEGLDSGEQGVRHA